MYDERVVEVNPAELIELSDVQQSYLGILIPAYGKILSINGVLVWKPNAKFDCPLTVGTLEFLSGIMRLTRIALDERKKVTG